MCGRRLACNALPVERLWGVAPDTYTAAMATLLHPLIVCAAGSRTPRRP